MSKRPSLAESLRQAASGPEPVPEPIRPIDSPDPSTIRPAGYFAATRVGKKKVSANMEPRDHKRLRQLGLERDMSVEALLNEAISDLFAKHGVAR